MNLEDKIYIAGHHGMVGSAIWRQLHSKGYQNLVGVNSGELDLRSQKDVNEWFHFQKPDYVVLAAAKVGGIHANNVYRAEFLYDNLIMECNVIHAAHTSKVKKLLFLGSSCIYPKMANQPLKEEYLLSGLLEPTNEPYAIAKIAGIKLCESYRRQYGDNFISAMPTNLYGPNDNYHLENSHVIPALIRKFHEARESGASTVEVWGTGSPKREFMYVDDLADASVFLLENYDEEQFVNIGTGEDVTIRELAEVIKETINFSGEIVWNTDKPDGTPRKLMDVTRLNELGWTYHTSLKDGIQKAYEDFKTNIVNQKI